MIHHYDNRIVIRWFAREAAGLVMLAALLFLSAGSVAWIMGWALIGLTLIWICATALVIIPRNPELLAERTGPRKGAKTWDTVLMSIIGLTTAMRCVVAGLDIRFGWSSGISLTLQIIMLVAAVLGYTLVVWATSANAFFAQTVRIQNDRDHTVATGGPYQFIRHPGYTGVIIFELSVPLMLGSWWALIPGSLIALLIVIRTALEDQTLQKELNGYSAYAKHVRYRLLPAIW